MIESLHLANEGAYNAAGTKLENLKQLNFIFGPNGSGKTTISRVIEGSGTFPDCKVTWAGGNSLEARVYNRDFVEQHFDAESSIKGIYTFGENVETATEITRLKEQADKIEAKLGRLRGTLSGDNEAGGKKKERETLITQFQDDIWDARKNLEGLEAAFPGLNKSKARFSERYLAEASNNNATARELSELHKDATTVFANAVVRATVLPEPDISKIQAFESSPILKKKVIGKKDVDIAALIEKLGNSDWVQQGRQYFDQLGDQCPFCQQKTVSSFKDSLEAYFDETYTADLLSIDQLLSDYSEAANDLLADCNVAEILESRYVDRDAFTRDVEALGRALESNISKIRQKRREPSTETTLHDLEPLLATVNSQVSQANHLIKRHNSTIDNLAARKTELTAQVWRRLLEDTKTIYGRFAENTRGLDSAILSLENQITSEQGSLDAIQKDIEENERKITSIKPTIDEINRLLKSFGFTNFELVESENRGFYEVKRPDGSDAKQTLSEGEKSFITFLYFYQLVRGSFSSSGGLNDKVVVFDDPVSSLDADILFIVCSLIKNVIAEMRGPQSTIKQVFVLTHNIYFHKEVTFDKRRDGLGKAFNDETFWVVRKTSQRSELIPHGENPIKSSYELLWHEVRQKPPSDIAIQNVTRRILEHYFKFYGGVKLEDLIDKFDGKDKMVCSALLSWANDGSHFATDDLFTACDPGQVDRYLNVFQRIFEESDHGGHFKMMMGDDYVPLPANDLEIERTAADAPGE